MFFIRKKGKDKRNKAMPVWGSNFKVSLRDFSHCPFHPPPRIHILIVSFFFLDNYIILFSNNKETHNHCARFACKAWSHAFSIKKPTKYPIRCKSKFFSEIRNFTIENVFCRNSVDENLFFVATFATTACATIFFELCDE